MNRTKSTAKEETVARHGFWKFGRPIFALAVLSGAAARLFAADAAAPGFNVQSYKVEGRTILPDDVLAHVFAGHTGVNVGEQEIVKAAADLQREYHDRGFGDVSVSAAPEQIKDGVLTLHVFTGATPQILVSGHSYPSAGNGPVTNAPPTETATTTNTPPAATTTNATPHIPLIEAYEFTGNDLLSDDVLQNVFSKYTGTNISFDDIGNMVKELTLEYRDRGYDTVSVTIPVQTMSNAVLKVQAFEGSLAVIKITGNHYFSSNNVMRALPGLKTNMYLNSKLFQPELDRANANQDRQIYPQIGEGPDVNTSSLNLVVKDQLPLHGKVELNNENSPATPDLRVNSSAAYNNLWQLEHSIGVQYSFSPEVYKLGDQWDFYDLPLVANYSAFYRLPLGTPESVADQVAVKPGTFGYNEATRKFTLPQPSGVPELNLYASRATIDTGVETSPAIAILDIPGANQIFEQNDQQDLTTTETIGFRLSGPLPAMGEWLSTWSSGLDFKTYNLTSFKTNEFIFDQITVDAQGNPNPPIVSTVSSPVPVTVRFLQYLPYTARYDGSMRDALGTTAFGLGMSVNTWYSGSLLNLQNITGSAKSHGHWVTITPSLSRDFDLYREWVFSVRADGQWASEPLISNEQFGAGGVGSVRGYHEGEVFGDTGWHVSAEQKTPPHVLGFVNGHQAFTLRGSIYVDYAEAYLLDPQGRPWRTPLWSTGIGGVASLGSHWEGRLLFSVPLRATPDVSAYEPRFTFSLTSQF